jgi:hypothetical protein
MILMMMEIDGISVGVVRSSVVDKLVENYILNTLEQFYLAIN